MAPPLSTTSDTAIPDEVRNAMRGMFQGGGSLSEFDRAILQSYFLASNNANQRAARPQSATPGASNQSQQGLPPATMGAMRRILHNPDRIDPDDRNQIRTFFDDANLANTTSLSVQALDLGSSSTTPSAKGRPLHGPARSKALRDNWMANGPGPDLRDNISIPKPKKGGRVPDRGANWFSSEDAYFKEQQFKLEKSLKAPDLNNYDAMSGGLKEMSTPALEDQYLREPTGRESDDVINELKHRNPMKFDNLKAKKVDFKKNQALKEMMHRKKADLDDLQELQYYEQSYGYGNYGDILKYDWPDIDSLESTRVRNTHRLDAIKKDFAEAQKTIAELNKKKDNISLGAMADKLNDSGLLDVTSATTDAVGLVGTQGSNNFGIYVSPELKLGDGEDDPVGELTRQHMSGISDIVGSGVGAFQAVQDIRQGKGDKDPLTILKGATDLLSSSCAMVGGFVYGKYGGGTAGELNHQTPKYVGDVLEGASQAIGMVMDLKNMWKYVSDPSSTGSGEELVENLMLPLMGLTKKIINFSEHVTLLDFQTKAGINSALDASHLQALSDSLTSWSAGVSILINTTKLSQADNKLLDLKLRKHKLDSVLGNAKQHLVASGEWETYQEVAALSSLILSVKKQRFYRDKQTKAGKGPIPTHWLDPIYDKIPKSMNFEGQLIKERDQLLKKIAKSNDTPQGMKFRILSLVQETVQKQINRLHKEMGKGVVEMAADATLLTGGGALATGVIKGGVALGEVSNSIFKKVRAKGRQLALEASKHEGDQKRGTDKFLQRVFNLEKSAENKEERLHTVIMDFLYLMTLRKQDKNPSDIYMILEALGLGDEKRDIWDMANPEKIYTIMKEAFTKRDV